MTAECLVIWRPKYMRNRTRESNEGARFPFGVFIDNSDCLVIPSLGGIFDVVRKMDELLTGTILKGTAHLPTTAEHPFAR